MNNESKKTQNDCEKRFNLHTETELLFGYFKNITDNINIC